MALLPETREVMARYDAWLAEVVQAPERLAARGRRVLRNLFRRTRNMVLGMLGVVFLAFLYGNLVGPIGFLGLLVMVLGMLGVAMLLATWPPHKDIAPLKMTDVSMVARSRRLRAWLLQARRTFPVAVVPAIEQLAEQLEALEPELQRLGPSAPAADDARRLLAVHMPRLLESYRLLPEGTRETAEARSHFLEGVQVVTSELERLTSTISDERMRALEIEGRFLESRYGNTKSSS